MISRLSRKIMAGAAGGGRQREGKISANPAWHHVLSRARLCAVKNFWTKSLFCKISLTVAAVEIANSSMCQMKRFVLKYSLNCHITPPLLGFYSLKIFAVLLCVTPLFFSRISKLVARFFLISQSESYCVTVRYFHHFSDFATNAQTRRAARSRDVRSSSS